MMNFTKYGWVIFGLLFAEDLYAQNMTSPYSVYGIGVVDHRAYNRTSGIGNTGLALKSGLWLISNNPASLAGLEKGWYHFDLAMAGKSVQYSGDPLSQGAVTSRDFGVKRAAFAVKLTNNWAGSIGFRQYSNVNYKYRGNLSIEGSPDKYGVDYEGDGGINHFYLTNALSLGKRLMAGVNLSVYSGSINRTEYMADQSIDRLIETKVTDFYSNARLEYGLLYTHPLNKLWNLSIGGRFATKMDLSPERTVTVKENSITIIDEELVKANSFRLPVSYGVGIALSKGNAFTITADYIHGNWKALNIRGSGWSMVNSHRLSGGIEWSWLKEKWNRATERKFIQLGGFVDNSYLSVNSSQVREFGFTLGYASNYRNLLYNLSLEIGKKGTISNGLIRENYIQLTLGISWRDFFFSKGRKYD